MGMKSKSGHFTSAQAGGPSIRLGGLKYALDLQLFAEFPKGDAQVKHIMADRRGHLPDTLDNRQKIIDLTNDESHFIGTGLFGKRCYAAVENGLQYWAYVKDGVIQNAGVNKPGDHRTYNELLYGRRKK